MPRPFLRFVHSLRIIKDEGTDADFYAGRFFINIPSDFIEPLRLYCGKHLPSTTIGVESDDDEPITVYILKIPDENTDQVLNPIKTALEDVLRGVIAKATAEIENKRQGAGKNAASLEASTESAKENKDYSLFSRNIDAAFDSLRMAAELRDYFLRVEGEIERMQRAEDKGDSALLIEA